MACNLYLIQMNKMERQHLSKKQIVAAESIHGDSWVRATLNHERISI